MEHDIVYYHRLLQQHIHIIEKDEENEEALAIVKSSFMEVFNRIKMIMISRKDRYYGCFLMNFELKIDFSLVAAAAVSLDHYPFRMILNPLLLGSYSLPEMVYILCHKIEHIVLMHPAEGLRYNPGKDPAIKTKLNIAMDASINDRLTMDSHEKGMDILAEPETAITSKFLHDFFKIHVKQLQAFDYYFKRIPDKEGEGGGLFVVVGDGGKPFNGIVTKPKRDGMVAAHEWTVRDDADEIESLLKRFLSDVCDGMPENTRGSLPAHQKEALNVALQPPNVSWKYILKRFVGTVPDGSKKTRTRLSRRQPQRYDISGRISDRIIKLVVAIDTSGSMDKELLETVFIEIFGIIGARKSEITIIECDAEIQRVYKVKSKKDVSYEIMGRGGTSFTPVIEYLNSHRQYRDAILIYFTDGFGERSIPRPLTYRNMWVLPDDSSKLSVREPYGEILVMD